MLGGSREERTRAGSRIHEVPDGPALVEDVSRQPELLAQLRVVCLQTALPGPVMDRGAGIAFSLNVGGLHAGVALSESVTRRVRRLGAPTVDAQSLERFGDRCRADRTVAEPRPKGLGGLVAGESLKPHGPGTAPSCGAGRSDYHDVTALAGVQALRQRQPGQAVLGQPPQARQLPAGKRVAVAQRLPGAKAARRQTGTVEGTGVGTRLIGHRTRLTGAWDRLRELHRTLIRDAGAAACRCRMLTSDHDDEETDHELLQGRCGRAREHREDRGGRRRLLRVVQLGHRREQLLLEQGLLSSDYNPHHPPATTSGRRPMRTMTRRVTVIAAIAALSATLAACGDSTDPAGSAESATTGPSAPAEESTGTAAHNDADTEFAQMMIVHHEGAVVMAQLALEKATNEDVRALADQIVRAQGPEIDLMRGWLESWNEELPDTAAHGGMDHGGMEMEGMDQTEAMDHLGQLSGAEFDRRFLELMTAHHQGAVEMAQQVLDAGENAEVQDLAEKIIEDQETEIATMQTLLQQL